jgi:hypothetical protein
MKRLFLLLAVAGLVAVPMAHEVLAKPKAKVSICHVAGKSGNSHIIVVSANAQKAHLKHGDCLVVLAVGDVAPVAGTPCCATRAPEIDPLTGLPTGNITTNCADWDAAAGAACDAAGTLPEPPL